MNNTVTQNEDGSFDNIECPDCHEILEPADQGTCCPFCGNAKGSEVYHHWIELEKDKGDLGQLCQDIAQLGDDPKLEHTLEHNVVTKKDYHDIDFQTIGKLPDGVAKDFENRQGVLHVGFNGQKELD